MNKPAINIQDGFLFQALKENRPMEVELIHGKTLVGRIRRFDRFAVILEVDGLERLIYKHAIGTLSPAGES